MIIDIISVVLLVLSALFSLAAAVGAVRFPDLLSRMHAASKPQILGLALAMIAIGLQVPHWGPITTAFLIVLFQTVTVPVAAHMIGRAGYRTKHLRRSMLYKDELADAVARAQMREEARVAQERKTSADIKQTRPDTQLP